MCLIAFAWRVHPRYPLIVAANRDEFYERPTRAAHWWDDAPVLAGRDERGGGTWMGMTRAGRFVALTNVRDPSRQRTDARSRGLLVSEVLADPRPLPEVLDAHLRRRADYNAFTLLAAECAAKCAAKCADERADERADDASMFVAGSESAAIDRVAPGVHGLSNAVLDTPWPKVVALTDTVRAVAAERSMTEAGMIDVLGDALADRRIAADDALPSTGISLEWERALSAPFIALPTYGTRSSTIVLVDADGRVAFDERGTTHTRTTYDITPRGSGGSTR